MRRFILVRVKFLSRLLAALNLLPTTYWRPLFLPPYDLSSDGGKITYFEKIDNANWVIYLVNSDGTSKISALTEAGTLTTYVYINSNGTQITFHSNRDFGKAVADDEHRFQIYTLSVN